jgi:hypothetical protein
MPTITLTERISDPYFQVVRGGQLIPPPSQLQVGDVFLTNRPLYDPAGTVVGRVIFHATAIQELANGDRLVSGNGDHDFRDGVIAVQASFLLDSKQSTHPIIGGTGKYATARGTMTRRMIDSDTIELTYAYTVETDAASERVRLVHPDESRT